jgi:hypothetical protein
MRWRCSTPELQAANEQMLRKAFGSRFALVG